MAWIRTQNQTISHKRGLKFLLVIAHPDDEVMFFSPFLSYVRNSSNVIDILCLSNGNDEGLGDIRHRELLKSGSLLNIGPDHIHIIDHPQLQDGMSTIWPPDLVADNISYILHKTNSDVVSISPSNRIVFLLFFL
jgi:N-acetylglucosaminylphosphatidylinositol deacetylase